jgi:hypothetical protein
MTTVFKTEFLKYATLAENQLEDNNVNWNFVDADLCMDGWAEKMTTYQEVFNYHADQFELDQAADRLEVLKTDYLGQ